GMLREWCALGRMPDEPIEDFIRRAYAGTYNEFGSALPAKHSYEGSRIFGEALAAYLGSDDGSPVDLFPPPAPDPVLTRDMLPESPAFDYAYNVAARQGVQPNFAVAAMLTVCAAMIHDDVKVERKAGHVERAHCNFTCIDEVGAGKTPVANAMLEPV